MINLLGERFTRLVVVESMGKNNKGQYIWKCQCDCKNFVTVSTSALRSKNTRSCGCIHKEQLSKRNKENRKWYTKHPRLKRIWDAMKHRCENPNNETYNYYGGKGICVCREWQDFYLFEKWSLNNGYGDHLTIDRIDENKDYCPENCRWTDMTTQNNHKSNNKYLEYKGEVKTLAEWCRELNLSYHRTKARLNVCGWTVEQAFDTEKYKTPIKEEND